VPLPEDSIAGYKPNIVVAARLGVIAIATELDEPLITKKIQPVTVIGVGNVYVMIAGNGSVVAIGISPESASNTSGK
jgi:hypothetical protein